MTSEMNKAILLLCIITLAGCRVLSPEEAAEEAAEELRDLKGPRHRDDDKFDSMQLKRIADSLEVIAKNMEESKK